MAENFPSATYFPLRWESTGEKWWYTSPIDCAAANGHYDLVRELIRLDANHLISLTSLHRLRRLESVWDDNAAKSRSAVARRLLQDSEISSGKRSPLIGAGYGAWLLYTAASAGDLGIVRKRVDSLNTPYYAACPDRVVQTQGFLRDRSSSTRSINWP